MLSEEQKENLAAIQHAFCWTEAEYEVVEGLISEAILLDRVQTREKADMFTQQELEDILALMEVVLDEDLLDSSDINCQLGHGNFELEYKVDDAWKALGYIKKVKSLLPPNPQAE